METIVNPVADLVARARREGAEIIYVNDNYGDWNSSQEDYSALDAYVRHLEVSIPRDCVAHIHRSLADAAIEMMERSMSAEITSCADVRLNARG